MPYAFTPEDYSRFQSAVLEANGDQAILTSILTDFQDTFAQSYAAVNTVKADNDRITAENQRLKETNMELFLRVGQAVNPQPEPPEEPADETGTKYKSVSEYLTDYFSTK